MYHAFGLVLEIPFVTRTLTSKQIHASQQANQTKYMVTVEMRNANELNFLQRDFVLPQVGLEPFTAVQQNPFPVPIDGLRSWCMLKCRRGCPTTKDGDLELHESTRSN